MALYAARSRRRQPDRSGRGPGGRRFKSCLPDRAKGLLRPATPVARAARPRRRREGDADPDLQFLTLPEADAVIAAIPDRTVDRDALGPVLRLAILAAATTGLRQSELLGLRWKHRPGWRTAGPEVRSPLRSPRATSPPSTVPTTTTTSPRTGDGR